MNIRNPIVIFRRARAISSIGKEHWTLRDIPRCWSSYVMLAPFFLLFGFFVVLPVLAGVALSFTHFNLLQIPTWAGLTNYLRLFLDDDIFIIALKNTLISAVIIGPIGYAACLFLAWLINELPRPVRVLMTFVFYAPSISGNLFVVWAYIFSGDSVGMINSFLMQLGIIQEPIQFLTDPTYMLAIVILVQIWMSLGTSFLSFIAGFQGIDHEQYEAGAIDGIRNRWQEFIKLTMPSMGPQLLFGAIMSISGAFSVGAVAASLTGMPSVEYATHTIINHIADYGSLRYEMGYASAISVVLFAIVLIANAVIRQVINAFASQD